MDKAVLRQPASLDEVGSNELLEERPTKPRLNQPEG